ncbi:MAG: DeoR/GlpR family DNA-binding transcription regulator [Breznakia sp.]
MKINRIQEMEAFINEKHSVSNEDLCKMFSVSMQTLRRDLKILEDQGRIHKVYGGVISNNFRLQSTVPTLMDRSGIHTSEKEYIGQLAAKLVDDNDIIFIDSGTTVVHMLAHLKKKKNVTIITHALNVMEQAKTLSNVRFISLGGEYNPLTNTFQFSASNYHYQVSKAFIATVAISLEDGLRNMDYKEGAIKNLVMKSAESVFVLCDSSKFSARAFNFFSTIHPICAVVSDEKVKQETIQRFQENDINIITK